MTGALSAREIGELLREIAPQVLGALGRRTAQIAAAFLVPEATMAQRISRAKGAIRAAPGSRCPARRGARRGWASSCTSST